MNNCTPYDAFLQDSLFMLISLLGTALLFALAGYYLGKKSNKNKNTDSNYKEELEDCKRKYNQLKISTTSGKIDTGIIPQTKANSPTDVSTNFTSSTISSAKDAESNTKESVTSYSENPKTEEPISNKNLNNISETKTSTDTTSKEDSTTSSETNIEELKRKLGIGVDANPNMNLDLMKIHFGSQYGLDDLKIIEGIGPKIAQILNENGITSWKELSVSDPEKIRTILLEVGGAAYKIHEPATWPQQAMLAHEGKFEELKKLQDNLKAGR